MFYKIRIFFEVKLREIVVVEEDIIKLKYLFGDCVFLVIWGRYNLYVCYIEYICFL